MEIRLVLAALAVFRAAELFSVDDGPFAVFKRLRKFLGQKAAGATELDFWYNLAALVNCPFCIGVWLSAVMYLLIVYQTPLGDFVLTVLAISGLQSFLTSMVRGRAG